MKRNDASSGIDAREEIEFDVVVVNVFVVVSDVFVIVFDVVAASSL